MISLVRLSRATSEGYLRACAALCGAFLVSGFTLSLGFDRTQIEEWALDAFPEPSGIVYHAERNTFFAVGDEGDVVELGLDGELLRMVHLGGDLEGVTVDPASGSIYVLREGHEIIFELDPAVLKIERRFVVDRAFEDKPNFLKRGGDGLEGLTFVPDSSHPEGGRFFAVNQYDPPVLVELHLALRSSDKAFETAKVIAAWTVDAPPLSDVVWDPASESFLVVSALSRKVHLVGRDGELRGVVKIPGFMPEGIAFFPDGRFAIAQDTGGVVVWAPGASPFVATVGGKQAGAYAQENPAFVGPPCPASICGRSAVEGG